MHMAVPRAQRRVLPYMLRYIRLWPDHTHTTSDLTEQCSFGSTTTARGGPCTSDFSSISCRSWSYEDNMVLWQVPLAYIKMHTDSRSSLCMLYGKLDALYQGTNAAVSAMQLTANKIVIMSYCHPAHCPSISKCVDVLWQRAKRHL